MILVNGYLGFSLVLKPAPYSIAQSGATTANLITLLIVGFFGVEAEEMFRASILVPSLLKYTGNLPTIEGIYAGLIIFAAILLFLLLQFYGFYTFLIVLGLLFIALLIELFAKPKIKKINIKRADILNHAIAIIFAATIFMMLHVFAYGSGSYATNINDYISAFSFAIFADTMNWMLQSAIFSRVTHAVNNIVVVSSTLFLPWYYGLSVLLIYIFFILTVGAELSKKFQLDQKLEVPAVKYFLGR